MSNSNPLAELAAMHPLLAVNHSGARIYGLDGSCLYAYTGTSMFPTLRALDFIKVQPCPRLRFQVGDVILFPDPGSGASSLIVVHRVVAVLPGGLRTRGDNNPVDDDWLVQPAQVIGRVDMAHRGRRRVPIWGGMAGLAGVYLQKRLRKILRRVPRVAARVLPGRSVFTPLLLTLLRPCRVVFATPGGPVTRLIVGRAVIGEYSPLDRRWRLRLPYRWLLNDCALPGEEQ